MHVVYFIKAVGINRIKIGSVEYRRRYHGNLTATVNHRRNILNVGSPVVLRVIAVTKRFTEKSLHKKFAAYRVKGEWFIGSPEIKNFIANLDKKPTPRRRKLYSLQIVKIA